MTGWERRFTGNYAREENFTILPNGISTKQNPYNKTGRITFTVILRKKPDLLTPTRIPDLVLLNKRKGTCHRSDRPQNKNQRKRKDGQILRPC